VRQCVSVCVRMCMCACVMNIVFLYYDGLSYVTSTDAFSPSIHGNPWKLYKTYKL
jgi:hypothetical protein